MLKRIVPQPPSHQRSQLARPLLSIRHKESNESFPAVIQPARANPPTGSGLGADNQIALRRAILCDALHCFQQQFVAGARQPRHLAQEAEQWLFSNDTQWPFSFINICVVLELDPICLRKRLQQWARTVRPAKYSHNETQSID